MNRSRLLVFLFVSIGLNADTVATPKAAQVVVVVWDGLRPDFVTEKNTPTLYRLAQEGVFFANHHASYPSSTEVNGAAIATGAYPDHSGIIGNREYRPDLKKSGEIKTEDFRLVARGDRLHAGKYLGVHTIAETLQAAGVETAVAGTKPVALFQDRAINRISRSARHSSNVFAGNAVPPTALQRIVTDHGGFPEIRFPNTGQDEWTGNVLTGSLWKEKVPAFSLLWLSEPDYSQHHTGPGSPTSLAAFASSDQILNGVLAALEKKGLRDRTDILVVSDHGFSTISQRIDLVELLRRANFKAVREKPAIGDIMVVGNGGSALLYVIGHRKETVTKLVEFLQNSDFAGAIFTTEEQPGCIKSDLVHTNGAHAPDVLVSMRWSNQSNEYGVAGEIVSYDPNKGMDDAYRVEGNGHHASMSSFDMHNTLIAAGPHFRSGLRSDLASGNIDLAPTIFHLLNVAAGDARDGRVLVEALKDSTGETPTAVSKIFEATAARSGFIWYEYVRTTRVDDVTYFDEGNGGPQR